MANGIVFELVIGTHFFRLQNISYSVKSILTEFCSLYTKMEYQQAGEQKGKYLPGKTFVTIRKDFQEYRFHINQLGHFLQFMKGKGIRDESIAMGKKKDFEAIDIAMRPKPKWKLRPLQEKGRDLVNSSEIPGNSRMLAMATGTGKTSTSMITLLGRGKRVMVCVLAKYMKKWVSDVEGIGDSKKIMTISGSKDLKSVMDLARDDPDSLPDIFVASLTTMTNWFKQYEEMEIEPDAYGCHPEDYCKALGLGAVLVDEAHEHLNSVWSLMCYSHVERFIGLSGTFLSEDRFIEMIQNIMFPQETRFDEIKMGKYINVYGITFDIDNFKEQRIRSTAFGSNSYSHSEFEKSISRNKAFLKTYLKFIEEYVREGYDKRAEEGDKCIVYASTIDMCGIIYKHLKEAFPKRDVRKYVDTDKEYDDIIEAEIKVSTPGSAGTALDMPGLISVFSHYCVSSLVQNIQMLGRLREADGKEMRYYYFHCNQIPKQIEYHKKRMNAFAERSKKIYDLKHPTPLRAQWNNSQSNNFHQVKKTFGNFSTKPGNAPENRFDAPKKKTFNFWKEKGSKFRVGRSW